MTLLLEEIRHNRVLWLLAFVPVVFVAQKLRPEAHTLLLDMIEAFDLHEAALVGSDIGAAICRCAVAGNDRRESRIAGLLLANGDAFDEHAARRLFSESALDEAKLDDIESNLSTGEGVTSNGWCGRRCPTSRNATIWGCMENTGCGVTRRVR